MRKVECLRGSSSPFPVSENLRRSMTHAETILWMHLKKGIKGMNVRRQHPIGIYVADLYCHKIKLIVETDGPVHDRKETKENDAEGQMNLKNSGYKVLRFINDEITKNIESVLLSIESKADLLLQNLIINEK
jgi:imidazole glycerol-phosphate synthase subunit HisF